MDPMREWAVVQIKEMTQMARQAAIVIPVGFIALAVLWPVHPVGLRMWLVTG
jgi:hypothetical protein